MPGDAVEMVDRMDAIASLLETTIGCKPGSVNRMENSAGGREMDGLEM
jgi:hypothetical protein